MNLRARILVFALACCSAGAALAFEPEPGRLLVDMPPGLNGQPLPVNVSWFLLDVTDVNAATESFNGSIYLNLKWSDSRLSFDAATFGAKRVLYTGSDAQDQLRNIWSPGISVINLMGEATVVDEMLTIFADGKVEYEARLSGEFSSDMDLRRFPFDSQALSISVESSVWDNKEMVLVPSLDKGRIHETLSVNGWAIRDGSGKMEASVAPAHYATGDTYSRLTTRLQVDREPWYYMWSIIFPLILVTFFAVSCFYWDEQSLSERVAQTLTCLLTVTAQSFAVSGDLPKISYFTLIDYAFLLTYAILLVVTVESIIVKFVYERNQVLSDKIDQTCTWAVPLVYVIGMMIIFWPNF